jgi:hypothetical protein
MKASLERTAILSKDISEQPASKYIVLLPDVSMTLSADEVNVYETHVTLAQIGRGIIAEFPKAVTWVAVVRDRVELITRKQQLERTVEHSKAEEELVVKLLPEMAEEIGKMKRSSTTRLPDPGQYI